MNKKPANKTNTALHQSDRVRAAEVDDRYMAPRDEFERCLCESWAAVLGLERVDIRENFFDLGGNSLLAVKVTSALDKELGINLDIAILSEHPTVEEFARVLEERALTKLFGRQSCTHAQFLVRMRPGTSERFPFFCLHGVGGSVLNISALAMALPADLPFYCFQDKGLDGAEPFESVEETARCYVEEIRQVQPHGPYYLGGTCHGGRVAFEMARRFEELGESVATLVLIDTLNLAFSRSLSKRERVFRNVRFYARRMAWHARRIISQRPSQWLVYISGRRKALRKLMREQADVLASIEQQMVEAAPATRLGENLKSVIRANVRAVSRFEPKPYGGSAVIFRASKHDLEPYDDDSMGWEPVVRGGIECFEIEGDHMSILEEPAVRLIAEKLDARLRNSKV
jgi:thioesterase domain-containing protein/acyl carrier protein